MTPPRPPEGKHSPLPWTLEKDTYGVERIWATVDGSTVDVANTKSDGSLSANEEENNAEFICLAVNLHAKLVAALEWNHRQFRVARNNESCPTDCETCALLAEAKEKTK